MKVLVAYASKRGSTAEIAATVAKTLSEAGLEVDCLTSDEVSDVSPYDAVVLGSAVYMKRWRGDAKHFLRKHSKQIAERPLWVFSSGPVGDPDQEENPDWLEPPKIVKKVEKLGARDHVVFGGRLPAEPHGPMEKAMVTGVPVEFRDRRDWDQIRSWAEEIASKLHSASEAP
ncbi:MAG TPA: flavodoxin domain-containing protein [Solirubrobacterales bacterium]|nr:flavodoxin domain-containing protein [Solirubrobacterales bacterium]